jgi:RNA ligase (TIGR02306 family)
MSTLHVGVEELYNVREHPNADSLDLANVGNKDGYQVVLGRGQFKSGDLVVYVPEGAIVPDAILEELGLIGKLGGRTKNVVKAIRLRGEVSQGLVYAPGDWDLLDFDGYFASGENLAESLGVVKFVPEVAIAMSGVIEAAPDLRPMFEVESVRKYHKVFEEGESVEITEKIHGTCFVATYHVAEDVLQVSSKGLSKDHHALKESDSNLYWRAAHEYNLLDVLQDLALGFPLADSFSVYGEVYGEGVQDLHYGVNSRKGKVGFAVYAMLLKTRMGEQWVSPHAMLPQSVPCVPVLYIGPYSRGIVAELTEGPEQVSGKELHMREGVVVQGNPPRNSTMLRGLALVKSVSETYLTRKATNGVQPTEYQ